MRLIDADAFADFLKNIIKTQKYDALKVNGDTLTVGDVLESVIAELDGTSLDGFKNNPTIEPQFDEWCDDCAEYDKTTHSCPRFNRVIRTTLDDVRKEAMAQRWIPVTERLPERNGRYIVTRGNDAGTFWNRVYIVNYSDLMGLNKEKHWWTGDVGKSNFERILDVLAWMPLPEPYKGEQG